MKKNKKTCRYFFKFNYYFTKLCKNKLSYCLIIGAYSLWFIVNRYALLVCHLSLTEYPFL